MSKVPGKGNTACITSHFTRLAAKRGAIEEIHPAAIMSEKPVQSDTMATGGVSEKKDISNADLQEILLNMQTTITEKMDNGFDRLNERVDKITEKLEGLEMDVDTLKSKQEENVCEMDSLKQEINDLKRSLLTTQVYSRKYHLVIYGVDGHETETRDAINRVRLFAKESLKLDPKFAAEMTIRNAHRLQKREGGKTPIIVVFMFWAERDAFLRAGRNLKGTRMSVRTDLPPELKEKRGRLANQAYILRRDRQLQTRVREKGPDVWIETRRISSDPWDRYDTD